MHDRSPDAHVRRMAIGGAWGSAILTLAFLAALIATPFMAPLPTEWRGAAAYAETFVPWTMLAIAASLVLVAPVLVLLVALHALAPIQHRSASLTGLAFGVVYVAIIAANDYVQLITVRGSLLAGQLEGLDPLVWTNPYGVFGALEGLGYLFQAIAFVVVLPVLANWQYARPLRWLLVANLVLAVATIAGQFAELYVLLFPGLVAWSLIFGPAMVLIALSLRALNRQT